MENETGKEILEGNLSPSINLYKYKKKPTNLMAFPFIEVQAIIICR